MNPGLFLMLLRSMEERMVNSLLRSPSFHRSVERVHKRIHKIQHGELPEDMGGTKLDLPEQGRAKKFLQLFWEELKTGHKPDHKNKK